MIPKIENTMIEKIEALDFIQNSDGPLDHTKKHRWFSKGESKSFHGKHIEKLGTLYLKGLNIYGYEFGIIYPKDKVFPIFLYQLIYVPKRALAIVNYPFFRQNNNNSMPEMESVLRLDEILAKERIFKQFKPQYFIAEEVLENQYNGIVITTDVEEAQNDVLKLIVEWESCLAKQYQDLRDQDREYKDRVEQFKDRFFSKDYGYTATKRYLGKKWTQQVFSQILR